MITALRGVTLTVVSGNTREPTRSFVLGAPTGPISVGTDADWEIAGAGVISRHLHFVFDGSRLYVAAAFPSGKVLLRGKLVESDWREIEIPSEVHFGAACIIVLADEKATVQVPPMEAHEEQPVDDEAITLFREPSSISPEADPPTRVRAAFASVEVSVTTEPAATPEGDRELAEATMTTRFPLPLEDAPTRYDNGALRELASQIAAAAAAETTATTSRLARDTSSDGPSSVTAPRDVCSVHVSGPRTRTGEACNRSSFMSGLKSAWRLSTLPQRTICALLLFALCAEFWSSASGAHAGKAAAAPTPASSIRDTVGALPATEEHEPPRPIGSALVPAARNAVVEVSPLSTLLRVDTRAGARAIHDTTTATRTTELERSLAIATATQRDALSAARTGKLSQAAELYQQLAAASQSPVFSKAATLARRQSVRTP